MNKVELVNSETMFQKRGGINKKDTFSFIFMKGEGLINYGKL